MNYDKKFFADLSKVCRDDCHDDCHDELDDVFHRSLALIEQVNRRPVNGISDSIVSQARANVAAIISRDHVRLRTLLADDKSHQARHGSVITKDTETEFQQPPASCHRCNG